MQTLSQRWSMLEPSVTVVGPDDDRPRPAEILFHGCGGLRGPLPKYAAAAKAAGWRAFMVASYGPRGRSRQYSMAMVCTGILLHGSQRAGDVLAALFGVSQRSDVDASKIVLAGWSHGGWGIMEAMSSDRSAGMLGVADPEARQARHLCARELATLQQLRRPGRRPLDLGCERCQRVARCRDRRRGDL